MVLLLVAVLPAVTSCASAERESWDLDVSIAELAPAPFATRTDHSLIWSGEELLVWGGHGGTQHCSHNDGAVYVPETETWRAMADVDLEPRTRHTSVAVGGERMLVWGGFTPTYEDGDAHLARDGAIYDPALDSWELISDAPQAGGHARAAVLGEHVVFGGGNNRWAGSSLLVYSLAEDTWESIPLNRPDASPWVYDLVAAGDEAVIIGGSDQGLYVGRFRVGDTGVDARPVRGLELADERFDHLGVTASDGEAPLAVRSGDVTTMYELDGLGRAEPVDDVGAGAFRPAVSTFDYPLMSGRMGSVDGLGVAATAPGDLSLWDVGTGRARRIQVPSLEGYCGTFVPAGEGVLFGWGGTGCDTGGVRIDIGPESS